MGPQVPRQQWGKTKKKEIIRQFKPMLTSSVGKKVFKLLLTLFFILRVSVAKTILLDLILLKPSI